MKLAEYQAKTLLSDRGIPTPRGRLAATVDEVSAATTEFGDRVAVKAQVRSGGRGKAGGVVIVDSSAQASEAATRILGSELGGERVEWVLVEEAVNIAAERYLAIMIDPSSGRPMVMHSDEGGVEIESMTDGITRFVVDSQVAQLDQEPRSAVFAQALGVDDATAEFASRLYDVFGELDCLLVEVNPLVETGGGELCAVDAKIEIDDSAAFRHPELFAQIEESEPAIGTEREQAAAELGLRLIELGGDVAVLANGAGLTMATMDAIVAAGGEPANFLEIGGDAYTKATPALKLVLSQPGVRSLLVNFCGAFARCDVMTAGVVEAWKALNPGLPVAFSISGTGMDEAKEMVRVELGLEPHDTMAAAVTAAVSAANSAGETA